MKKKYFIISTVVFLLISISIIIILSNQDHKNRDIVIGKKNYESLQEAIVEAKDGDTVELYQNVEIAEEIKIEGKSITLANADGIRINLTMDPEKSVISITDGGSLYLKGVDTNDNKSGLNLVNGVYVQNQGNLKIGGILKGFVYVEELENSATITIAEDWNCDESSITIVPSEYVSGECVVATSESKLTTNMIDSIAIVPEYIEEICTGWGIDTEGKIKKAIAQNATTGALFGSLDEAIDAAASGEEIRVLQDIILDNCIITENKKLVLVNKGMTDITISRGAEMLTSLFTVNSGGQLQIGDSGYGSIVIDGKDTEASGHSLVENNGDFELGKNGILAKGNAGAEEIIENVGGAVRNTGKAVIRGTLEKNAAAYGGGIYNSGELIVDGAHFKENHGWRHGGGICNEGELSISNSCFEYNMALYSFGGAVYSSKGNTLIADSVFTCNRAKWNGGAVFARNKDTVLTFTGKNTFKDNINTAQNSETSYIHGFEISVREAVIKLQNSVFLDEKDGETVVSLYHFGGDIVVSGKVQGATFLYGEGDNTLMTVETDFDESDSNMIIRPYDDRFGIKMISAKREELVEKCSSCIDVWSYTEEQLSRDESMYLIDEEGYLTWR